MINIKQLTQFLETIAPKQYQESYDNAGLLTGDPHWEVSGILIALDSTEAVVDEAIAKNCNVIIAHHPIIFKGLKSLTGKNYIERTIIKAIKHDIAIYAIHTNLDNIHTGVNKRICDRLGLINTRILSPKTDLLSKLTTFIPEGQVTEVTQALYAAGAGQIGEYKNCSFSVSGEGTFLPTEGTHPHTGTVGQQAIEKERRVEVILPSHLSGQVLNALKKAHPYEEVAYYLQTLENAYQEVGSGMIGELQEAMPTGEFLQHLKSSMQLSVIKHTPICNDKIKTVAVCGGAGIFLLGAAKSAQADIYITADVKYHEYFDADGQLILADIGHYESEVYTKDLLFEFLKKKFTNIALYLTEVVTNPITYLT